MFNICLYLDSSGGTLSCSHTVAYKYHHKLFSSGQTNFPQSCYASCFNAYDKIQYFNDKSIIGSAQIGFVLF